MRTDRLSGIGVLYESDEWSDHKLAAELVTALADACGEDAPTLTMIDMTRGDCVERALACGMLVSRVFASARFRGHDVALESMERLVDEAQARGIVMINEPRAHRYEVSKVAATRILAEAGLMTPAIIAFGMPEELDASAFAYPCVIKPDCGGRSTHTLLARDADEARRFITQAPAMPFVVQEYVEPEFGYVTRIEVVDDELPLIAKRSIGEGGLSSYHAGSTYELYPDCPDGVRDAALRAARALGIGFGSFDVIETRHDAYFIDANSVSNVSEDCTELFGFDLMRAHARGMARRYCQMRSDPPKERGDAMLSIKDVYEKFDEIGCCSFATLDGNGGVDSRIAHFFAYDDEGLYLRTMTGKPFFRQMIEGGRLSVCGERTDAPVVWDDENMPHFQPGYMMRVSGSVRLLTDEELSVKAAANPMFAVATYDINKYPETVVLVMDSAWGELYDYDFNMVHRDHKILRERFSWGGATFVPAGFTITDECIECGACMNACTHKAIVAGTPYRILGERCDECGNCHHACPVGAVIEKGVS